MVVACVALAQFANAQNEDGGKFTLAGGLQYSTHTSDLLELNNTNLNVAGYYWLNSNWGVGLDLGFGTVEDTYNTYKAYASAIFLTPLSSNGIFNFYTTAGLGINGFNPEVGSDETNFGLAIIPGFQVELGKGWALNFNMGGITYDGASERFSLGFGQNAGAGIQYTF
ncbi:MAG: outer membrane beta-barrel protein [Bacteroidales bacterium]